MNLLEHHWIPVRTQSGASRWIAPWQITENLDDDPIVAINAPRPDFTGALMQFLIGLVQTAYAPSHIRYWDKNFRQPPAPADLQEAFAVYADCFHFGPERPSFMEDLELDDTADKPIEGLLIDAPGGNTLKENKDFFIKRDGVRQVCPEAAAMALLTLQINAPSGGVGHRTSLRGGGPLTTLVMNEPGGTHDTIWHNVWLNILPQTTFESLCSDGSLAEPSARFPWMGPTRVSDKNGTNTTPDDLHPLTLFWATPRRIRLDWKHTISGTCDITGQHCDQLLTAYTTRNYGANYEGAWRHPLSPYRENKNAPPSAQHPQPGGIHYRHWLSLTALCEGQTRPAAVVDMWRDEYRDATLMQSTTPRIWAFGYDMDNMKARCWYESSMPLHYVETDPENFRERTGELIESAELAASYTHKALKQAWFSRPADAKGDTGFIKEAFWQTTEMAFYKQLEAIANAIDSIKDEHALDEAMHQISADWLHDLQRTSLTMFDQWAASGYFEAENPGRISVAHNELRKTLHGKKLTTTLGLPAKSKAA